MVSLRVLREILKSQHDRLRDFAELTTLKVLKAFADSDASVSSLPTMLSVSILVHIRSSSTSSPAR